MRVGKWLACTAVFLLAPIANTQTPLRPNILLLMAEDMSARVGAFGDSVAVTPNLDALAAQGVRYTNTFATAGVCAPSRAALDKRTVGSAALPPGLQMGISNAASH